MCARGRYAVREEDQWIVRVLVGADAVRPERHVVVRMHVDQPGQHVVTVREGDDPRSVRVRGSDRPVHDVENVAANEDAAVSDNLIAASRPRLARFRSAGYAVACADCHAGSGPS